MPSQFKSTIRERHIKRAPRIDGRHSAVLVTADGNIISATVTNVSGRGFCVNSNELLRVGEYVALRIKGYGDFPGQIRWALGAEAGGVFLEPVVLPIDQVSDCR